MRGLTPLEREILNRRLSGAPRVPVRGSANASAMTALKATRRLAYRGEIPEGSAYTITDLGRLALRVCPAGEP